MHLSPTLSHLQESARGILKKISWKSPRTITGLSMAFILTTVGTYYFSTTTSAAAVMVNGQQIGLVENVNSGKNLVETILRQQGEPFGLTAKTEDQIAYKPLRVKDNVYRESRLNADELEERLTYSLEGYKLEADGSLITFVPSKEDADKLLKAYEEYYVQPSDENKVASVNFAEDIKVEAASTHPDQMQTLDEAYQTLLSGKQSAKDYTVQANDSWWLIARKNDMLTDEVLAGNPGSTEDTKLKPGQTIKLVSTEPYLTVISKGTYSGKETIPYDVETNVDHTLNAGQTKVVEAGRSGSKLVTYSYVQKNGIDITKQVVDEKVIEPPVNKVVAKGPDRKPVMVAYGVSRGSNYSSSASTSTIANRAQGLKGTSYVFGGSSQRGFDCSGFTKYVYATAGISLPRTSYAQYASGSPVSKSNLKSGDLVFFSTYSKGASHVGIYIGGGRFVHASNPSSGVKTSSLNDSFYSSRYVGARRY